MVKNGSFFTIFLLLAVSSFAQDMSNRYLYIEGSADKPEQLSFFRSGFSMEADGCGYVITSTREEAFHTLRFNITPDYSDPDYEQYVITISLQRHSDSAQLVSFGYTFATLEETQPFIRTLFLNAVTSIPLPLLTEENMNLARGDHWYKWIYLRVSLDCPIVFYFLQPTDLIGKAALHNTVTNQLDPLDHIVRAMPGATIGAEFQLLNFLSIEFDFQMSMGDTRNNYFVNMAAATEVKFPVKLRNLMLVPYGAFSYALNVSPVFSEFPPFAAGGGAQLCARAGKKGIIFVDANYMFSFSDAVMHNPYLPDKNWVPAVIHYKRSQLGIGVGYKFGLVDRPKKTATFIY